MGKSKRNRERRKELGVLEVHRAAALFDELLAAADEAQYLDLLRRRPALLTAEMEVHLVRMRDGVDFGVILESHRQLLVDSRADPGSAWRSYQERGAELERRGEELAPRLADIDIAHNAGQFEKVIELTDAVRPEFAAAGLSLAIGVLHAQRGLAYAQMASGDARENAERAVIEFRLALELSPNIEQRAHRLMHLGLAFGRRIAGDRAENVESSVAALSEALGLLDESSPPALLAIVRTNLATALLRREQGSPAENRGNAVDLCRQALGYRSPERDVVDWAHTQITLAGALEGLVALGLATLDETSNAYSAVVDESGRLVDTPWLVAAAEHGLGGLFRGQAVMSIEARLEADEVVIAEHEGRVPGLLAEARSHYQAAAKLGTGMPDTVRYGRILADLARIHDELGERELALTRGKESLALLTPANAPQDCAAIAGTVGSWLGGEDDWQAAAAQYRVAVEAAEISIHARISSYAREQEIKNAGRLYRWAAHALARAGSAAEAAVVLETGRSREARRRLKPNEYADARMNEVPPELRERYEAAIDELAAAPLGVAGTQAGGRLQTVLTEIRYMPGFADFATGAEIADLLSAVEPGWPLVYINPTPTGVLLLRADCGDPAVRVRSRVLDTTGSSEVFMRIMTGTSAPTEWTDEMVSYMGEASGFGETSGDRIREALDVTLPWIGEKVVQPLWEWLDEPDVKGVTLVPCGPLTLVPLHACNWDEDGEARCLLDFIPVRFAPSALLAGVALAWIHRCADGVTGSARSAA